MIWFDLASPSTQLLFEERYAGVLATVPPAHPAATVAPRLLCNNSQTLAFQKQVVAFGGEGLILQKPQSFYLPGRSTDLLKIKGSRGDMEALVLDVKEDGSMLLKLPSGNEVGVPASQCYLNRRPHIGDVVEISFGPHTTRRHSSGSFYTSSANATNSGGGDERVVDHSWDSNNHDHDFVVHRFRDDLEWDDVVVSFRSSAPSFLPGKETNHWSYLKAQITCALLEEFAKKKGFDPLVAENLYNSMHEIMQQQELKTQLQDYETLCKILIYLYPELKLDKAKLKIKGYWQDKTVRRKWFDDFASLKNFDPLISSNWQSVSHSDIESVESGTSVLRYYGSNLTKAITDVYPELGLDVNFLDSSKFNWQDSTRRKKWFDDFAKSRNIDPLIPSDWHTISHSDIESVESGKSLLKYYDGNLTRAIADVYPEASKNTFLYVPKNYWRDKANLRNWFENFANKKKFDSLNPNNWYSITIDDVNSVKGGRSILYSYKGNLAGAIMDCFPDIGLLHHMFHRVSSDYWRDQRNSRNWFDEFARSCSFDPLFADNWYNISSTEVYSAKKGQQILKHYKNLYQALTFVYPEVQFRESLFKK